jgi:hypothetical protein
LIDNKLIEILEAGGGRGRLWKVRVLVPPKRSQNGEINVPVSARKGSRFGEINVPVSARKGSQNGESLYKDEQPIEQPNRTTQEQSAHDTAEAIYRAYPKKVGKPVALKSIERALKTVAAEKIHNDPAAYLLERTQAYAAARAGAEEQFTCNPSTWFNQSRFNDDPSTWVSQTRKANGSPCKTAAERGEYREAAFDDIHTVKAGG